MPSKKGLRARAAMTNRTSFLNTLNPQVDPYQDIPEHLHEYITDQDPSLYTPEDHASWRFIMRVSKFFFSTHAHPLYLAGLNATGISTERIPLISEMDAALRKMGWRAVAINGFIPPSVFLEFQSLKILAIACDMRKIENLGYTPSPDIVHEAAGHAPIVADPDYRAYLEAYGQVARHAIISKQDLELYDAIFELSETKENPKASAEEITRSQKKFELVASQITDQSEAALLARMAWWTTEYGLIEKGGKALIYGAGLLSSILESHLCILPPVKKIPFDLETVINTSYDITRPQPQLFVAKDFESLTQALEAFADKMCFRRGGVYGLETAKKANATVTLELDSGIQLSGTVLDFEADAENKILSFTLTGAKQISYHETATTEVSSREFGSALYFPMFDPAISTVSGVDIQRKLHGSGLLTKSGARITGHFKKEIKLGTGTRLMILENVQIADADGKIIFEDKVKPYPLILGSDIKSVFGGAADRKEFALRHSNLKKKVKSHKTNFSPENDEVNGIYSRIRKLRELGVQTTAELSDLFELAKTSHPDAWLIFLELLELSPSKKIMEHLEKLTEKETLRPQIQMGLELLK